jgi:hypothetical protein
MVEAVYVHWGRFTNLLRNVITITLHFGTNTTLLSDFEVGRGFNRWKGGVFTHKRLNCSGCESYRRIFTSMHSAFASDFVSYPRLVEYRNEARYIVLYNHMVSSGLRKVVMLDSDVALLVPSSIAFDVRWYQGCDAVLTYNQVSARIMPIHPTKLDAYWAGTALISRNVLRDYLKFVWSLYTDRLLRNLLIIKQRTLPTINDMTSWCLFTVAQLAVPDAPVRIINALRSSSAAPLMRLHRMCNTQPISWSQRLDKGVINSASNEINVDMIECDLTGCRLDGAAYVRQYEKFRASDMKYILVAPELIMNATPRLYSLHSKQMALSSTMHKIIG